MENESERAKEGDEGIVAEWQTSYEDEIEWYDENEFDHFSLSCDELFIRTSHSPIQPSMLTVPLTVFMPHIPRLLCFSQS